MARIPDTIVLRRDRDLGPRQNDIWIRRSLFGLICVVPVLALLNVFGQRPETASGAAAAAGLSVSPPARVRGGLLHQAASRSPRSRSSTRPSSRSQRMRAQQIAAVEDVEWGILETNGTMSFIPK